MSDMSYDRIQFHVRVSRFRECTDYGYVIVKYNCTRLLYVLAPTVTARCTRIKDHVMADANVQRAT